MDAREHRFSAMDYIAGERQRKRPGRKDGDAGWRKRVVEEMRGFLLAARGASEEDERRYGELLNRAVLGYPAERERMYHLIHDELMRRGLEGALPPGGPYGTLAEMVFSEVIGLNVLEPLLKDREGLEEIQVVGTRIFTVRNGRAEPAPVRFSSPRDVERIQHNLVLYNNERFSPRKPWAEVSLVDGSRVTMTGFGFTSEPTLTIRIFPLRRYSLAALCEPEIGTLNPRIAALLRLLVRSYVNMIIIGPTNSGKTHLLKCLIAEMPDEERIVTIESRFELMLGRDFPDKNVVEFEADDADEARTHLQAFKLALRQSPRRICHAEIRDQDANIYVRACTRGHAGSIACVHVSELEDVPDALTDMCMLDARGMNPERLRKRIVEFVVQVGLEMAVVNGRRRLVRLAEFSYDRGNVVATDLIRYDFDADRWIVTDRFSPRLARKMARHDPQGWKAYLELAERERREQAAAGRDRTEPKGAA